MSSQFLGGILRPELFMGLVSSITAHSVRVNLTEAGYASGSHFSGNRYGRGEVGEFVLIEGQQKLMLGRVTEVKLPDAERRSIRPSQPNNTAIDAIGIVQLLGSVEMDNLAITAGVDSYPRLSDRVYAAPHQLIAAIPRLMEIRDANDSYVLLEIGVVSGAQENSVVIKPEKLFGRHCAILGATGGGKSWTTAKIIEECLRFDSKLILIDATGEYRDFSSDKVKHCHLGEPVDTAASSKASIMPPTSFTESDFIALFEPAGKVQGPKLRAAIRSLRLAAINPALAPLGFIKKIGQTKAPVLAEESKPETAYKMDNPSHPFDASKLVLQLEQECVWPDAGFPPNRDTSKWGGQDESSLANCLSLITRINAVLMSPAFRCVFSATGASIPDEIDTFLQGKERLLRICLSGVSYEFNAREIIANALGRLLLSKARTGVFRKKPIVVIVDEAHNFLGHRIGVEDYAAKLDAFEIIAKEGRKYGLSICLTTQRPRDITEGVLSQMGTLIVHRLTNDRDREVVERACGEIDRAASAFLPNLQPGEVLIIGADFPIPLTIKITKPITKPLSDSANFQTGWMKIEDLL
jgi:hypothetical protein